MIDQQDLFSALPPSIYTFDLVYFEMILSKALALNFSLSYD